MGAMSDKLKGSNFRKTWELGMHCQVFILLSTLPSASDPNWSARQSSLWALYYRTQIDGHSSPDMLKEKPMATLHLIGTFLLLHLHIS